MTRVRFEFRHARASTVIARGRFQQVEHNRASDDPARRRPLVPRAGPSFGRYEYKFLVDGQQWWNDPHAPKVSNV
jgi:hypothetical protein